MNTNMARPLSMCYTYLSCCIRTGRLWIHVCLGYFVFCPRPWHSYDGTQTETDASVNALRRQRSSATCCTDQLRNVMRSVFVRCPDPRTTFFLAEVDLSAEERQRHHRTTRRVGVMRLVSYANTYLLRLGRRRRSRGTHASASINWYTYPHHTVRYGRQSVGRNDLGAEAQTASVSLRKLSLATWIRCPCRHDAALTDSKN